MNQSETGNLFSHVNSLLKMIKTSKVASWPFWSNWAPKGNNTTSVIYHTYCTECLPTDSEANTENPALKPAFFSSIKPGWDVFQLCIISMKTFGRMLMHPHVMVSLFIFRYRKITKFSLLVDKILSLVKRGVLVF